MKPTAAMQPGGPRSRDKMIHQHLHGLNALPRPGDMQYSIADSTIEILFHCERCAQQAHFFNAFMNKNFCRWVGNMKYWN